MTNTPTTTQSLNMYTVYFPVDYSRSLSHVFQDVTKYIINGTGSLRIISLNWPKKAVTYGAIDVDLPTWAIDWRQPVDTAAVRHLMHQQSYEASRKNTTATTANIMQLYQDYNVRHLRLRGIRLGTITRKQAEVDENPVSRSAEQFGFELDTILATLCTQFPLPRKIVFAQTTLFPNSYMAELPAWRFILKRSLAPLRVGDIYVHLEGAPCVRILHPVSITPSSSPPSSSTASSSPSDTKTDRDQDMRFEYELVSSIDNASSTSTYLDKVIEAHVQQGTGLLSEFLIK